MTVKLSSGAFYGRMQTRREVAGMTFVECAYTAQPRGHLPWHLHESAYFYLVVAGACEERLGRTTRVVGSNALVFHPAGAPHSNCWGEAGGRAFHVEFSQSRIAAIGEYTPVQRDPVEVRCGPATWFASQLYREYQKPDDFSSLVMEGLALEILAEISRAGTADLAGTTPQWLHRARDLLHDRFAEPLALGDVAKAVGVHPVHFARCFRRRFGCPPGDYLRKLRVESACRQLATSETPLIEVALTAGFADQSHFTKTFRRIMGMTPGEFRRNFRTR
jgi:AraC family transcriptional regulator